MMFGTMRDIKIWRLVKLGWTQENAGKVFGLERRTVGDIIGGNIKNNVSAVQQDYYKNINNNVSIIQND